jgi:protein-S-isoprenylcysteine O-methyltransferase Ste14
MRGSGPGGGQAYQRQARRNKMNFRKVRRIPVFIGAILLLLFAKPEPIGIVVGMVLVIVGEVIRIWAAGHLQKNEFLTVTGPYAYVKNPLYIGTILITAGFCIFADNIYILAAATFAFCFHYIPYKKKIEGDRLKNIFGSQYVDYDEKVPEYIPRATPYSNVKARWRFKNLIENSEEGILLIIIAGIILILSRPFWRSVF